MTDLSSLGSLSGSSAYQYYLRTMTSASTNESGTSEQTAASTGAAGLANALFQSPDSGELSVAASGEGDSSTGLSFGSSALAESSLQAIFDSLSLENEESASALSDMISAMDTDGSGTISEDEFVAARPDDVTEEMAQNHWASFDTEATNELSTSELQTAMAGKPPMPPSGGGGSEEEDSSTVSALDTDGDGVVSLEELLAGSSEETSETDEASIAQQFLSALQSYETTGGYGNTTSLLASMIDSLA